MPGGHVIAWWLAVVAWAAFAARSYRVAGRGWRRRPPLLPGPSTRAERRSRNCARTVVPTVLGALVDRFNRPRALVPPALRDDLGVVGDLLVRLRNRRAGSGE